MGLGGWEEVLPLRQVRSLCGAIWVWFYVWGLLKWFRLVLVCHTGTAGSERGVCVCVCVWLIG